jgi:type VI secretion system secreted protein VgrG
MADRFLRLDIPTLGKDTLRIYGFTGREAISQPFHFDLQLLSENASVAFENVVGQRVTVRLRLADGSDRCINSFVSRFTQSGKDDQHSYYHAHIVPWLWFLTRTTDCRIFQNKTVRQILESVFTELGFTDFEFKLEGTYEPLEYCVQYRETDFNFVSRLMEEFGIFYLFQHDDRRHTLVIADSPSAHRPNGTHPKMRYLPVAGGAAQHDAITSCHLEQEFRSGKYAVTDYNFKGPSDAMRTTASGAVQVGDNRKYEVFDYPGRYLRQDRGTQLTKIRMQEEECTNLVLNGTSSCPALAAGDRFDLAEHYRDDLNRAYVVIEVQHNAAGIQAFTSGAGAGDTRTYSNQFASIPYATPYRPPRITPKPIVEGVQTAVVVGPEGEEIYTDPDGHGQVKVQFHWDRYGKRDQDSSCWIRVSHLWAGKGWGAIAIPRIGQEVIVDFLEGDPDRPIITGRVYNAEQTPPYALPANKTQSGIKSRSSKDGGTVNFNEIRMEDKKGSEELYLHAEKDETIVVENDKSEKVGNNETVGIGNDRSETVGGNETLSVVGNRTRTVNQNEVVTVLLTRTHTVGANEAVSVGGAQEVSVVGAHILSVGGLQNVNVGAEQAVLVGRNQDTKVGNDQSISVGTNYSLDAGKSVVVTAGDEITIRTGKALIQMKKSGDILIEGKDITIKGSGEVVVKGQKVLHN